MHKGIFNYYLALLYLDMEKEAEAKERLLSLSGTNLPERYAHATRKLVNEKWGDEIR